MTNIKKICGITGEDFDDLITSFIEMYRVPLRKTIKEEYYNNIQTRPIIDLGIDEIVAGHVLDAIEKTKDHTQITISSFSFKEETVSGESLIKQGYDKIAPFRKDWTECAILSSTKEDDMVFK